MPEATYLDAIVHETRARVAHLRDPDPKSIGDALAGLPPAISLEVALRHGPKPAVIAEFKRISPSQGTIREGADPASVAELYVDSGAAAISVLTHPRFGGSLDDLRAIRNAVKVPVLCKDFILCSAQLLEARRHGADAALLIAAALEPPKFAELFQFARAIGLEVLCETHDAREIERALAVGARIIGVNARDLHTFEVDLERVLKLRDRVPHSFVFVAESGISSREDVARLRAADVDAMLVGTHLMRAEDPGLALLDLTAMG